MLGKTIGDLEPGDVFKTVEYELTPLMATEYAHGNEEFCEWFHSSHAPGGRQMRIPTFIHADKMRLIEANCTEERRMSGVRARDARVHYEYHVRYHNVGYVGETFVVSGRIIDKYWKRNREFLVYEMEVHTKDGRHICSYQDKTLLRYRPSEGGKNA